MSHDTAVIKDRRSKSWVTIGPWQIHWAINDFMSTVRFPDLFSASGIQEFVTKPQDTAVIKGQTAVMKCAVANREGQLQWAKDGLMLGK